MRTECALVREGHYCGDAEAYRDPALAALEQDRIFAKTWQLVGHTEQVRLPGDYFTCTVAEEPLVITRAEDGAYGYGSRGRSETAGNDAVTEIGNGGYGGYGNGAGTGYADDCDPIYDGTVTADPNYTLTEADKSLSLSGYGSAGALDDTSLTLADMLTYAIQDEYLARAEYNLILGAYGNVRPFTNIVHAEETHIAALLPLFDAYGITAPPVRTGRRDAAAARAPAIPRTARRQKPP